MSLAFEYLVDRPQDVPLVINWWQTVWGDRMGSNLDKAAQQLISSLSKTELPVHILATIDGQAVGTAALKLQELADIYPDRQYWVGSVFVSEDHRGERIASELTLKIVELANKLALPQLYLQTVDLSGGLYGKLGWERVEQINYKGEETLLMVRKL